MINRDEIIAAAQAKPLGDSSIRITDRNAALDGFLKRLYSMKGYTVADNVQAEVDLAVRELEDRLVHRYAHLTLGEVWLALDYGIQGEYGKDTRLTVQNYLQWIATYSKRAERQEAIEELNRIRGKEFARKAMPVISAEEQARRNERACKEQLRREWQRFKETGELDMITGGCAEVLCDYLVQKGKLNARPETMDLAAKRGRARYFRKRSNLFHRYGMMLGIDERDDSKREQICIEKQTKHELLAMHFESLRARGAELVLE